MAAFFRLGEEDVLLDETEFEVLRLSPLLERICFDTVLAFRGELWEHFAVSEAHRRECAERDCCERFRGLFEGVHRMFALMHRSEADRVRHRIGCGPASCPYLH